MLDIGWSELLVVGAVALVAIGPKDLPKVMHAFGTWVGKARRAFVAIQHDMERLAYEAEQEEERKKQETVQPPTPPDKESAP